MLGYIKCEYVIIPTNFHIPHMILHFEGNRAGFRLHKTQAQASALLRLGYIAQ